MCTVATFSSSAPLRSEAKVACMPAASGYTGESVPPPCATTAMCRPSPPTVRQVTEAEPFARTGPASTRAAGSGGAAGRKSPPRRKPSATSASAPSSLRGEGCMLVGCGVGVWRVEGGCGVSAAAAGGSRLLGGPFSLCSVAPGPGQGLRRAPGRAGRYPAARPAAASAAASRRHRGPAARSSPAAERPAPPRARAEAAAPRRASSSGSRASSGPPRRSAARSSAASGSRPAASGPAARAPAASSARTSAGEGAARGPGAPRAGW
uniref:Orf virus homologue of retroviral pseudoprotease protein n=1 Tax=Orf virus TaxID=10258 RepID=Q85301_ORFV|nr:ORF4 [Orf virus]